MNKLSEPRIGTLVTLRVPCLGNEKDVTGVCYDVYEIGDRKGYAFIFENGRYDGFSPEEVELLLFVLDHYEYYGSEEGRWTYKFENVMKLSTDFDSGVFDATFSEAVLIRDELIRTTINSSDETE